jgi:transposase
MCQSWWAEEAPPKQAEKEESTMNRTESDITRVHCVDLAKEKFQVHTFSRSGERLSARTLSRARFDAAFSRLRADGSLVVMEACASSHYWGRELTRRGFRVKLVPAQFVAKRRMGSKTDGNDADAIYAVHCDPRVRAVPVKSAAQQDLCAEHRLREHLVGQRTAFVNQLRGMLAERGVVAPRGWKGLRALLGVLDVPPEGEITPALLRVIGQQVKQIESLDEEIAQIERRLAEVARNDTTVRNLDSIHGVGLITATAVVARCGYNLQRFASSRQFAASLGIAPREHSSGQTRRLGAITKRGDPYLRKLLVQCAQSIVRACQRREDTISQLAQRLLQRRPRNTVVVAIANRLARIVYAVIKHGKPYQSGSPAMVA